MDLADCFITDPPYNVDYEGSVNAKEKRRILNDHMATDEFGEFLNKAFAAAYNMKPGAAFYIWHANKETINFRVACDQANLEVKQTLIWNKNAFTLGRKDYQLKHEPFLYGWKRGGSHYFVDDRTWSTVIDEAPLNIDKLKATEAKELLKQILAETRTSVIDEDKPSRSEEHPTMKPIKLIAKQMLNSTKPNGAVLDTFGGSGTTLIVAEQLERRCYMVELD